MNPIQQFNEANNCFYLDFTGGTFNESIGVTFSDNSVYKAKSNGVSNAVKNATTIFPATIDGRITNSASGYSRIFCNKSQVTGISIDLGISGAGGAIDYRNINLDASFMKQFPKLKKFYFKHYAYSRNEPYLNGKVTGDWAENLPTDLEILNLEAIDYPNSNATFDINNISAGSKLKEVVFANFTSTVLNSYLTVNGDLSKIPASCNKLMLGGDRTSAGTNNVTGAIPAWVEEFSRIGRNNINQNLSTLNPYIRHLSLEGSNVLSGSIPSTWYNSLKYLRVLGNNIISGTIPSMSLCTNIYVAGKNELSGSIPSLPICTSFFVQGNNSLSGEIKNDENLPLVIDIDISGLNEVSGTIESSSKLETVTISGNNTISGLGLLPKCVRFSVSGKNFITGNPFQYLPMAKSISITGLNKINNYVSKNFPADMSLINISGRAALTQSMVDQLLSDLANTTWVGTKRITIKGLCEAPSQLGLSMIQKLLLERGVTSVSVNS